MNKRVLISVLLAFGSISIAAPLSAIPALDFSEFDKPLSGKELKEAKENMLEELSNCREWLSKKEQAKVRDAIDKAKTGREFIQISAIFQKKLMEIKLGRSLTKEEERELFSVIRLAPEFATYGLLSGLESVIEFVGGTLPTEELKTAKPEDRPMAEKVKDWVLSWF